VSASSSQALAYIRGHYKVPARRGQRILYGGGEHGDEFGTITGGHGPHLIVRLDSDPGTKVILHPTWAVEYLEVMWRCDGCGKWSHAKRRPKHHQRWDDAEGDLGECGPFIRYEARRIGEPEYA